MTPQPINIHTIDYWIDLKAGSYGIYVLGGWGVKTKGFSVSLRNIDTNETIQSKPTLWPIQTFILNNRAKRILSVKISDPGRYLIKFENAKSLRVTRSNLFIRSFMEEPVPNQILTIYFH